MVQKANENLSEIKGLTNIYNYDIDNLLLLYPYLVRIAHKVIYYPLPPM